MKEFNQVQLEAVNRYYKHLSQFGYMNDTAVSKMLTGILLIDTLEEFKDFVTEEYFNNVKRILRELDCCTCTIAWDDYKAVNTQPFLYVE